MRRFPLRAALLVLALRAAAEAPPPPPDARPLFDGKSLDQWEGNAKWWRVEDGAIAGGSLSETVPHNDFLATTAAFRDFDLRLKIRITGAGGFVNSGIQIRSQRAAKGHEMVGYQVDAGDGWWGKLYDESRRNRVIGEPADAAAVNAAIRKDDWNEYVIRAEGPRIRSWINGVPALDYTEPDANIPRDGRIGIQVHGGGKALVQVKDVTIADLGRRLSIVLAIDEKVKDIVGDFPGRTGKAIGDWNGKIRDLLAIDYDTAEKITVTFRDFDGIAHTTPGGRIDVSTRWTTKHPEDIGLVVHELVHVIQDYPRGHRTPGWVVEGIADWIRYFHLEPEKGKAYRPRGKPDYLQGYLPAAAFLNWMQEQQKRPLLQELNRLAHRGELTPERLEKEFGCTPEAAWRGFVTSRNFQGAPDPAKTEKPSPVTPEEQRALFTVPPGFEIELVAAESEGVGKFITVDWDQKGRLWSMTALEYPVDGNENKERADALYANPAKDKVLVYDRWAGPGPHTPRVFAEGLAIPLGILPYQRGVYVQHGHDLAFLSDTDGDGKADQREVILTGFGVQDSHLFPHQFTRAPGNWMWLAQGAFNYSKVKTSKGVEIQYDQTRMAKFRADGSDFDITSNGPCNIWGLVLTDEGEAWIQEANDFGYPVMPFHEYANYPGCSDRQWKSYAPEFPGTAPHFKMGGTGLSGLALSDRDLWPAAYADVMYVANPILRKVQAIKIHREGPGVRLEKLGDLVQSSDEWFRPVALRTGPDGCVYVVDWYNKIISHNEVPRNHPDRDKVRGRVWRVKPAGWTPLEVPDFTTLPEAELLAKLGGPSQTQTHLAWQAIVDRKLTGMVPALRALALDRGQPAHRRIPALWALEGLSALDLNLLKPLLGEANANLRREAVRCFNEFPVPGPGEKVNILSPLADDADPAIRAEVIRTVGRLAPVEPSAVALLVGLGREALNTPVMASTRGGKPIPVGPAYDRAFERYLVRMALEKAPAPLAAFLASPEAAALPVENQLWASLALPPEDSVARVAALLPRLQRAPNKEEVLRLVERVNEPAAGEAIRAALGNPATRDAVLDALLEVKTRIDPASAGPLIGGIARDLLKGDNAAVDKGLALAGGFRLEELEPELLPLLENNPSSARAAAVLRALAEIGGGKPDAVLNLALRGADDSVRNEAVAVLASLKAGPGAREIFAHWRELTPAQRRIALDRLTLNKAGAQAVAGAIKKGAVSRDDLDGPVVERLQTHLVGRPDLEDLIKELGDFFQPVLGFNGQEDAWGELEVTLDGPFTVETWVRLKPGINNADGILGLPDRIDVNFFDSKLRVYAFPPLGDVVVAKKPMSPDLWMHVAVVRDAESRYHLYQNGELDTSAAKPAPDKLVNPRLAWTTAKGGLEGALTEYRIWDRARTAAEIRANFDRSFAGQPRPEGLVFLGSGDQGWGKLQPGAAVTRTHDLPPLLTPDQAKALDEKFAKYEALGHKPGDVAKGKQAAAICTACHLFGTEGGNIGPNLSGVGAMGLEAILRNLLTPSAAMEPGYRIFRAELKNGEIREGFLVSEDKQAVVLRNPGANDLRLARKDIARTSYLRRSLMPEGLLDGLPPEMVTDLLAYLQSLK